MDPISKDEAAKMRQILERFYGPTVQNWTINYAVYEALGRLIERSALCTRAMHLVPRPWDFSNPAKWAQRQVRQAIVRYLSTPEGEHYLTCMKGVAFGMRNEFEMASLGL